MAELTLSSTEFKALSSDTRVQIIKLLKERNHTLTEIASKMEMASPSIKQHLDILLKSEIIEQIDEGRKWKYYTLTRKGKNLLEGDESDTTILIVLSISAIALVGFLLLFASSFGIYYMSTGTLASSETMAPPQMFGDGGVDNIVAPVADKDLVDSGGGTTVAGGEEPKPAAEREDEIGKAGENLVPEDKQVMWTDIPTDPIITFEQAILFLIPIVATALIVGFFAAVLIRKRKG
ncbi:MAG: winged helix-turn-helix domain-containing protein [Candidatus Diapherotrites archaeon]